MTMATSPCPPWCRTDHARFRNHGQLVYTLGDIAVHAFQYDADQDANVSVVVSGEAKGTCEIDPARAHAFVRLMEALGHPELAAAIRETAALMAVAQGDGVPW